MYPTFGGGGGDNYPFALGKNRTFVTGSSIKRITTMLPRLSSV